jgi:hypothetical protein
MLSAHRESVRDFATTDFDIRMDIARQVVSRREALGYTPAQLAESAKVAETNLILVEGGIAFDDSHEVVCAALIAIDRLESLRDGKVHLRIV